MHQQGNRDEGCATTTALPPHHSRLCTPSLAPPVARMNSSSPHGMAPNLVLGTQILTIPEKSNSQWLATPPQHLLTQTPRLTVSRGKSFQTSTFSPKEEKKCCTNSSPWGTSRPCTLNYHILIEWSICCWEFKAWIPLNSKQSGHLVRWIQPNPSPFDSRLNLLLDAYRLLNLRFTHSTGLSCVCCHLCREKN